MVDELEEYKCKFCDNKIIAGYRCVDCYISKIDKIPDKPYKEDDFTKEYGSNNWQIPNPISDDARLRGFDFPLTGTTTGDQPVVFERNDTTGGTATTYNPWFRKTWRYEYPVVTSGSTNMGISTSTDAEDLTN